MTETKQSFEEALETLEEPIAKLESDEVSLDESLAMFEEGMALIKVCSGKLDRAEKQFRQLVKKDGSSFELEDVSE